MERYPSQNLFPPISPGLWALSRVSQRGLHGRRCPSPMPPFTPPGSHNRAPVKRDAPFPEPSPIISHFPVNGAPPQVHQRDPYGGTRPQNLPHPIPWKVILPSEYPVREPPPCSLTVSPWTGILRNQSHWPIHFFVHVCLPESPKRSPPTHGEKHKVTTHGAQRRRKAHIQWGAAWFLKGIVNDTAISTPVPCSPRHDTFHFGLGRPEPR